MTTIIGSSVIYNRDGTTIQTLTAQGGIGSSTATIVRSSSNTVVVLVTDPNGTFNGCNLPSDAEIGDVVEIYSTAGNGYAHAPSGETFVFNGASVIGFAASAMFRKVSSTEWGHLIS